MPSMPAQAIRVCTQQLWCTFQILRVYSLRLRASPHLAPLVNNPPPFQASVRLERQGPSLLINLPSPREAPSKASSYIHARPSWPEK